jgi:uncharacterized protein YdeI (YjbR/CyaY-like superfamily)
MAAKTDPRVDTYIENAAPFARPILTHLRAMLHEICPDAEETIRWRNPSFQLKGKVFFGMAAFKAHLRAGFWQPEMSELVRRELHTEDEEGGQFGRVESIADLPDDATMRRFFAEAARLSAQPRVKASKPAPAQAKPVVAVPTDLAESLAQRPKARETFERFSPSHRREYVQWITEAKRAETRSKRLATALEWLEEGKPRNWQYMKC